MSPGSLAATLFGGVSHSESLPPANERYPLPGPATPVTPALTPEHIAPLAVPAPAAAARPTIESPAVEWFPIPEWMAGQWFKKGDLSQSMTNLRTGITTPLNKWTDNAMTVTWGHQKDRLGNIWHANFIPSERDGSSDGILVRFITVAMKCESATPQQVVTRSHYIVTETEHNRVQDAFQQESLNDYTFLRDGELENTSSNRVFDYQGGRPIRGGNLLSNFTRTAAFAPTARQNNIDLAASLDDFLKSHSLSQLARQ
jgi:hypothetical protein